jgi:hypothetical protein
MERERGFPGASLWLRMAMVCTVPRLPLCQQPGNFFLPHCRQSNESRQQFLAAKRFGLYGVF